MCPARRRWRQVLAHESPSPTARRTRARAAINVTALARGPRATIAIKMARGILAMIANHVTISGRGTSVGWAIPAARVTNVAKSDRSGPAMIAARVMIATRGTSVARGRSMRPLAAT